MRAKRAFTLIEVLAAVVLVSVGIVAMLGAISSLTRAESRARLLERMHRLAVEKYDEMISTGGIESAETGGDFTDRGIEDLEWTADIQPTGTEYLESLTITVSLSNGSDADPQAVVEGLVFRPPTDTGEGAAQ